jgi:hypothetical protein
VENSSRTSTCSKMPGPFSCRIHVGFRCEVMLMLLFLLLIQLGSTAIGLKIKDGVVLAIEKRVTSPLLVLSHFLSGNSVK